MERQKLIIDCDPGQDDAVMLLMALASPEAFSILGITTVAGNVPLALTQRNARIICELAGRTDIPVFAGRDKPLERQLITAESVHGKTGIDGIEVYEPTLRLQQRHAVDFIVETLAVAEPDSVTLVPTGPLTNIAAAITRRPAILRSVRQIVLMGGAMREGGNTSPAAEFNMLVDPEAAQIVLRCGRPLTIAPLDVTHQALATPAQVESLRALRSRVADAVVGMLEYYERHDVKKYGIEGAPLHDPCTIAYLLEPGLFKSKPCNVEIETSSPLTLGHTVVDFWEVTDRPKNATWLYQVDSDGFFTLLRKCLARYQARD